MRALFAALRLSLRAIARSKVRAALTILGILIGVAAVVIVVALGNAVRDKVMGQISTLGANTIFIFPQDTRSSGARDASRSKLTEDDAIAIGREANSVAAITPMSSTRAQLVSGDKNASSQVFGVEEAFFSIMQFSVEKGVMFTPTEMRTKAKVCILGETVREALFGAEDGVGAYVRIGKYPFRVVGILKKKGQSPFGEDQDDRVLIPIGTFRTRVFPTAGNRVQTLVASASDERTVERATAQIEDILRQRHNIDPEDQPDFQIMTQAEIRKSNDQIFGFLTALLSSIAAISLVVGGIGVMNIMLVSVTERTREIGIRMAIGASQGDILFQFLIEAIVLSLLGGLAGLLLGVVVVTLLSRSLGWAMTVPIDAVVTSFVTSATIGVVFGFLPARRAARLDPIDALRHE
ncbi:MAG: ABC transporter permease [Polyangiaceae bacterium]